MEKVQTALLVLLRAGLWERKIEDLSCFPLSAGEWKNLYLLSRQQTVTGIVFREYSICLNIFCRLMDCWFAGWQRQMRLERKNMQMNKVLDVLCIGFEAGPAGITEGAGD